MNTIMATMKPLVSIILPAYNSAHLIARAIESVLAQSFHDWELLIIDDGSTDGTGAVAESYAATQPRVKVITNPGNKGVQYTLARGLQAAEGDYVARIDADDLWCSPDKLERQVDFLTQNPTCVLVGTGAIIVSDDERELLRFIPPTSDAEIRHRLLLKNCFMHSSVLFKKDAALSVGGYEQTEAVLHIEDYDLWLKLGTVGELANLASYDIFFTSLPTTVSARNRLAQFKRTIALIARYRKKYPRYYQGAILARARYYLYHVYTLLPKRLRHALLRRYKQF